MKTKKNHAQKKICEKNWQKNLKENLLDITDDENSHVTADIVLEYKKKIGKNFDEKWLDVVLDVCREFDLDKFPGVTSEFSDKIINFFGACPEISKILSTEIKKYIKKISTSCKKFGYFKGSDPISLTLVLIIFTDYKKNNMVTEKMLKNLAELIVDRNTMYHETEDYSGDGETNDEIKYSILSYVT